MIYLGVYEITHRFDYAGINLLIPGSALPPIYYGMYCQFETAMLYIIVTVIIAIFCFVVCIFEWIHRPENVKYKGILFGGFGSSLAIPVGHMIINDLLYDNYGDPFKFMSSLPYYLLMGASYLGGLYIYVMRWPEKNHPGKYNIWGHSHQLWHLSALLGMFWTYQGAIDNYQMRQNSFCPA